MKKLALVFVLITVTGISYGSTCSDFYTVLSQQYGKKNMPQEIYNYDDNMFLLGFDDGSYLDLFDGKMDVFTPAEGVELEINTLSKIKNFSTLSFHKDLTCYVFYK